MFETSTRDRMTLMHSGFAAAATALLIVLTIPVDRRASGDEGGASDTSLVTRDRAGSLATASAYGVNVDTSDGFAANLGTNGRSCASCHVAEDAWSFTPQHARSLASDDPLFSPNDGSDCPPVNPSQGPEARCRPSFSTTDSSASSSQFPTRRTSRWRPRPTRRAARFPRARPA